MTILKNKDPEIIGDTISIVSNLLIHYGWYVLIVILVLVFVWNKYLHQIVTQIRQRNDVHNREDDPIEGSRREQMERARRRQQEVYDRQLEEYKRKELEKQNERKRELNELQRSIGKKDNERHKPNEKPFRDNSFNPLMGSSSGSTYRPRACGPTGGG